MGAFKNPCFMSEFAYRTKINYYQLLLNNTKDPAEKSRIEGEIKKIQQAMEKEAFEYADYYEVTQLINSLVGLLIFPEQAAYNVLSQNPDDLEKDFPILWKYINGKSGEYKNNYVIPYTTKKTDSNYPKKIYLAEPKSPRKILNHMRNAAAHYRIGIHPVNGKLDDGRTVITHIVFSDIRNEGKPTEQLFELKIEVADLESLLMEISDKIIHLSK